MIKRCPCCNAQLKKAVCCPRCRAELSDVFRSEKTAQYCLSNAINAMLNNDVEKTSVAINQSLKLKKTEIALVFREFFIQQQSKMILELLAQTQLLEAKRRLYDLRFTIPYSKDLQQLNTFTDYLLTGNHE